MVTVVRGLNMQTKDPRVNQVDEFNTAGRMNPDGHWCLKVFSACIAARLVIHVYHVLDLVCLAEIARPSQTYAAYRIRVIPYQIDQKNGKMDSSI